MNGALLADARSAHLPSPATCYTCTGDRARLSFSLAYAAPEVIQAWKAGATDIVADASVDIWALGVCLKTSTVYTTLARSGWHFDTKRSLE